MFLLLAALIPRHTKILKTYTELKQVKYTQQLQRQKINENDWQHLKSHYAWIWRDYKKMLIETSLWDLTLGSMNLWELKYGYRMDISVGGCPIPLNICSLVYNKSQYNHHFCNLHILNINMRGLDRVFQKYGPNLKSLLLWNLVYLFETHCTCIFASKWFCLL